MYCFLEAGHYQSVELNGVRLALIHCRVVCFVLFIPVFSSKLYGKECNNFEKMFKFLQKKIEYVVPLVCCISVGTPYG